jgi:predicted nucleic acid-binding protein
VAIAEQAPVYLDASAVTKLIAPEQESAELLAALAGRVLASSELVVAEVPRAVRRIAADGGLRDLGAALLQVEALLAGFALVPINHDVLKVAGGFASPVLRTLDAIHVASSLLLDDLGLFISYDARQLRAAAEAGLAIASPGRP